MRKFLVLLPRIELGGLIFTKDVFYPIKLKKHMVLCTGFEPAAGFLLRITKPLYSAILPTEHFIIF